MNTDRPNAADYGDAFLDVAREWKTCGDDNDPAARFWRAVTARAAQYAERPADRPEIVSPGNYGNAPRAR